MDVADRLRISRLLAPVTALGPGRRLGLWVQGCTLACTGCASVDTWDTDGGRTVAVDVLAGAIADALTSQQLDGLTLTGGEPFEQPDALAALLDLLAHDLADRDVLVFTGLAARAAQRRSPQLWSTVDAAVCGPYVPTRGPGGWLEASANQTLVPLTPMGRRRYAGRGGREVQATARGSELVMAGLPDPGDLDRFRTGLAARGIELGGSSWQS